MNKITLTKDFFIEIMNEIEKQFRHDSKCSEAFSVILPNDYISNYNNSYLLNPLIKILQIATNDSTKDSLIEYYMYELDFGKEFKIGSIKINNKYINLQNASDLWDALHITKTNNYDK